MDKDKEMIERWYKWKWKWEDGLKEVDVISETAKMLLIKDGSKKGRRALKQSSADPYFPSKEEAISWKRNQLMKVLESRQKASLYAEHMVNEFIKEYGT